MNPQDLIRQALLKLAQTSTDVANGALEPARQIAAIPQGLQAYYAQDKNYQPPQTSESAERGLEMITGALFGGNVETGALQGNAGYIGRQAAGKAGQLSDEAVKAFDEAVKAQPGGLQAGGVKLGDDAPQAFQGFDDLSTKVLERMRGMKSVAPETITNLAKAPDVKQAERDLLTKIAGQYDGKVPVQDFAEKVKSELVPLNMTNEDSYALGPEDFYDVRYESVNLPSELRGNVGKYRENIYESPIETSAGQVHWGDEFPNYFGHTRVEDLGNDVTGEGLTRGKIGNKEVYYTKKGTWIPAEDVDAGNIADYSKPNDTRRVIELQSDLFQKGRLDREASIGDDFERAVERKRYIEDLLNHPGDEPVQPMLDGLKMTNDTLKQLEGTYKNRQAEIEKLKPYENTWHERMIREEVKKAAMDGKTKLQFPVGETAMKIEGLGENSRWYTADSHQRPITPERLQVGGEVTTQGGGNHIGESDKWIVTDVLGDGKFKAVPKRNMEIDNDYELYQQARDKGFYEMDGDDEVLNLDKALKDTAFSKRYNEKYGEQFDISGKMDTNNPIHKFYESEVGKYLKNKYGAQRVKDAQGVEWWETLIDPSMAKKPVEAFGLIAALTALINQQNEEKPETL